MQKSQKILSFFETLCKQLINHRSAQVASIIILYFCLAQILPLQVHQFLYSISLFIKDLLILILPMSIMFFIAAAVSSFEKKAPLFVIFLFLFEAISNGCSVWYAYGWANLSTQFLPQFQPHEISDTFAPLWRIAITKPFWWSADKGTILGILTGILSAFYPLKIKPFIHLGKKISETILTKFFAKTIPLFVLGFVAKMYNTKIINQITTHYAELLLWVLACLVLYITMLFILGSGQGLPDLKQRIKNLLPAGAIAFSSGCSLSTMPWTILGAQKNVLDKDLAKAIIPATTNIQQIGDCIINSFFCFVIYKHFYGTSPDLMTWSLFSIMFVLARFATAAVLGGAIFIMLPIYENYLHFTPEMTAIILAFNVILDPIVTSANVVANGALCRVFEKAWNYFIPTKAEAR